MCFPAPNGRIYRSQIKCKETLDPTATGHSNRLPWDTHTECQNGQNTVRGECALAVGSSVGLQSDRLFAGSRSDCRFCPQWSGEVSMKYRRLGTGQRDHFMNPTEVIEVRVA
jgi:hypothetical protein